MKAMYYSEKVKKYFETEKECLEAEKKYDEEHALEIKEAEEKKELAKEVENAYSLYVEAQKKTDEAFKVWVEKKNEFVNKYHTFHMTWKDDNDGSYTTISEIFDNVFKPWF